MTTPTPPLAPESEALMRRIHVAMESGAGEVVVQRLIARLPHAISQDIGGTPEEIEGDIRAVLQAISRRTG